MSETIPPRTVRGWVVVGASGETPENPVVYTTEGAARGNHRLLYFAEPEAFGCSVVRCTLTTEPGR
jgi:hypothetical protein